MAEGGLDIVSPKQTDDSASEPNALRVTGRAGNHTLGFGVFVDLMQLVLGRRVRFVGRFPVGALGKRWGTKSGEGGRKQPDRGEQSAGDAQHTIGHWSDLVWAVMAE